MSSSAIEYKKIKEYFKSKYIHNLHKLKYKYIDSPGVLFYIYNKSLSDKSFVIAGNKYIYIISNSGIILQCINLTDLSLALVGFSCINAIQVDTYKLACIVSNAGDSSFKTKQAKLIIIDFKAKPYISNEYFFIQTVELPFKLSIDAHSFLYKNSNHIYICSRYECPVDWNITHDVLNCIIQEQRDGKVIWQWETIEHPELYDYVIRCSYPDDPHINCIEELDDDHLLVSYRNIGFVNICKSKNSIEWVIGEKRNDLGFKDLPCLQHCIEWMNPEHTKFATFNNNWDKASYPIETLIKEQKLSCELLATRPNSQVIIYDLENKTSKAYDTGIPASPRQGNVIHIKDNIFDINYGHCLLEDKNNVYRLGLIQEKNLDTNKIFYEMRLSHTLHTFKRGLN